MKKLILATIILSTAFLYSCKKEAGVGGKTTIKGSLVATFFCTEDGSQKEISGAKGQRVFISYGGGSQYDDNVRAGTNGEFEFKYLHPGTYKISAISECNTCSTGIEEVSTTIEVGKKDKDANVGELKIKSYSKDFCDGPGTGGVATAKGNLNAFFINGNNGDTLSSDFLANERVYLIYGEGSTQGDNVRSSGDGSYEFSKLRVGKYKAYSYSDCILCINDIEPVYVSFEIKDGDTEVKIPEIKVVILK